MRTKSIIGAGVLLKRRDNTEVYGVVRYVDPKGRFIKVEVSNQLIIVLSAAIRWLDYEHNRTA